MKKCVMIVFCVVCFGLNYNLSAQSQEAKQLLLNVEKLASLKNILTDLKKGYDIVSHGYNTIKNISEGNFDLHQIFLNGLLEISPAVKNYKRIKDIILAQSRIIAEYKISIRQCRESKQFTVKEIEYINRVYKNLFNKSAKNLDALITIVTANKLRMSDDERLGAIDNIWKEVQDELTFLRYFNNSTKILALQRVKESNDVSTMNELFNVN